MSASILYEDLAFRELDRFVVGTLCVFSNQFNGHFTHKPIGTTQEQKQTAYQTSVINLSPIHKGNALGNTLRSSCAKHCNLARL